MDKNPKDNTLSNGPTGSEAIGSGRGSAAPISSGLSGTSTGATSSWAMGDDTMGTGPRGGEAMGHGTANSGPVANGPIGAGRIGGGPVDNGPVSGGPISSSPIGDGPTSDGPIGYGPVSGGVIGGGPIGGGPIGGGPIGGGPIGGGSIGGGPAGGGPIAGGTTGTGPVGHGRLGGPISAGASGGRPADGRAVGGGAVGHGAGGGAVPPGAGWVPPAFTPPGSLPLLTHQPPRRRFGKGMVSLVVAGVLGAGLLGGVTGVALADGPGAAAPTSASAAPASVSSPTDVSAVAAKVTDSVVQVDTQTANGQGIGSGVIISSDGRVLTNYHVVAGARAIRVTLADGRTAQARVVAGDQASDLALLQVSEMEGLSAATLGDSSGLRVGDQVIAIGSPGGLQGTVTTGIVSALGREVTIGDRGEQVSYKAIQTDASINQGNSGGPLFNAAGEVVGINSAIYSPVSGPNGQAGSVGIGFSIPVDTARQVLGL